MANGLICILTVHGIGFEQAPTDDAPGYADGLHERLSRALGPTLLADDPQRQRTQPGENGAVYVQSLWLGDPDGVDPNAAQAPSRDARLSRLGAWSGDPAHPIDASAAPLRSGEQRIAHVALVYSRLEAVEAHIGAATVVAEMTAISLAHYVSLKGLVGMLFRDADALLHRPQQQPDAAPSSLQVRTDLPQHPGLLHLPSFVHHQSAPPAQPQQSGILSTVRELEDDVAAYVSRNDLRERVRDFVREAILRLALRDDVDGIVVNAHSNGTVVSYDVLRDLPASVAEKVRWFVTAGSPLRKYAELFTWGTEAGSLGTLAGWTNFWDEVDPVADPLAPPEGWRRGDDLPPAGTAGSLFHCTDPASGERKPVPIADLLVDNRVNGGSGGLPSHDYWDNTSQVVEPIATLVRALLA